MLRPLGNNIVVKLVELQKENTSGPSTVKVKPLPREGIVIAVGKGILKDMDEEDQSALFIPPDVSVGNRVLINTGAGVEFFFQGESFLVVAEEEILGEF